MIGVSLPVAWLMGEQAWEVDRGLLLQTLKENDVRAIELRTVRAIHSPEAVLAVAEMLWDMGFLLSVHGEVKTEATAVDDVFLPLRNLLSALRQPKLNITIHPINGNNEQVLNKLADYIEEHAYPVTIALENNRLLPDKTQGDSTELVLKAVTAVDRKSVGICFDFGHYLYYRLKNHPEAPVILPPKEFFQRVIHTHIHALNGLKTHYPLNGYQMPLTDIFEKLSFEYFGLYNIELDFLRFQGLHAPEDALLSSVKTLRESLPICAGVYDDVRDHFDEWFFSALKSLEGTAGTQFGLIHASSYLFNTNGYRWGMDIAFRNARFLADTPNRCAELLGQLDLMVISHGHRDHFEKSTVKTLANTNMEWVIPDFLYDTALEYGISPEQIHIAKKNEPLTVGKLTLLPFESRHYRPGTGKGVAEYGYYVTAENAPSMAFPVDIRDFSLENMPDVPKADYCFANVWLGDGKALEASYAPVDRQFAEFMLAFSSKNIFLTHLNENGRKDQDMWRDCHGEIVKAAINELSPETKVTIPKSGEVIAL